MRYLLVGISLLFALGLNETNLALIDEANPKNMPDNTRSTLRGTTVWSVDNEYYLSPAESWLADNGWRRADYTGNGSYFRRVPGYSMVYVAFRGLFGPESGIWLLKYFQLLLFLLSVACVWGIASLLFTSRLTIFAVTFLYGCSPFFSSYTAFTITESITPQLMVFYIYFLLRAYHTDTKKGMYYALAALLLGCAIMTRPYTAIAGLALPWYLYKDYGNKVLLRWFAYGLIPFVMMLSWGARNMAVTGEFVLLEKAMHPQSTDRFKPELQGLFGFAKAWGEDGYNFNKYQLPMWAAARRGDTTSSWRTSTIGMIPPDVVKTVGRRELGNALWAYQVATLQQAPYVKEKKPMPDHWLPEQLTAREQFFTLTDKYRTAEPLSYIASPLKYLKRMVLHSNTSHLFIFQEEFRSNLFLNLYRWALGALHILCYLLLIVSAWQLRRSMHGGLFVIVPLLAIAFFIFMHREIEQRYMLPFLPILVMGIGWTLEGFFKDRSV